MWHASRLEHSNREIIKIGRKWCRWYESLIKKTQNKVDLHDCSTQKWSEVAKDKCPELEYLSRRSREQKLCISLWFNPRCFFCVLLVAVTNYTDKPKCFHLNFPLLIFHLRKTGNKISEKLSTQVTLKSNFHMNYCHKQLFLCTTLPNY